MDDLYELSDTESYALSDFELSSSITLSASERSMSEDSEFSLPSDYEDYTTWEEVYEIPNEPPDCTDPQPDAEAQPTNNLQGWLAYVWTRVRKLN